MRFWEEKGLCYGLKVKKALAEKKTSGERKEMILPELALELRINFKGWKSHTLVVESHQYDNVLQGEEI